MQGGRNLRFVIQQVYRETSPESVIISSDVVERMIRLGQFSMGRITIQLSNQLAETTISLCLDEGETYTISRFPRSLLQDEDFKKSSLSLLFRHGLLLTACDLALETRQNQTTNSNRWASRTPSQQIRRKNWVPPDLSSDSHRVNTISRYSASNYILGDSSPTSLGRFARLFKSGSSPTPDQAQSSMPNVPELAGDSLPLPKPDEPKTPGVTQPAFNPHQIYELAVPEVRNFNFQERTYVHRSASTSSRSHDTHPPPFDPNDVGNMVENSRSAASGKGKESTSATTPTGEARWNFF